MKRWKIFAVIVPLLLVVVALTYPQSHQEDGGTCTLTVSCASILDNMSQLDGNKVDLVPADGVIFPTTTLEFYEGESVFDLLERVMREEKIHLEFTDTPLYQSAYIEGINNLYELDCGPLSGWMYQVNGEFPNYGSGQYTLTEGDSVAWLYTCNLGDDIGGHNQLEWVE